MNITPKLDEKFHLNHRFTSSGFSKINEIKYQKRFKLWKNLRILALVGVGVMLFVALFGQKYNLLSIHENINNEDVFSKFFIGLGIIIALPWVFYSYFLAIVHWKERYKGTSSDTWVVFFILFAQDFGGLILIISYYIKHILPDMKNRGLYKTKEPKAESSSSVESIKETT